MVLVPILSRVQPLKNPLFWLYRVGVHCMVPLSFCPIGVDTRVGDVQYHCYVKGKAELFFSTKVTCMY